MQTVSGVGLTGEFRRILLRSGRIQVVALILSHVGCQDCLRRRRRGTRPDVPAQRTRTDSDKHAKTHCDANGNRNRHAKSHCDGNTNSDGHSKSHSDGHTKCHSDGHTECHSDGNPDFDAWMSSSECDAVADGHSNFAQAAAAGTCISYEAESGNNTLTGSAFVLSCPTCSGGQKVGFVGNNSGTLQFNDR